MRAGDSRRRPVASSRQRSNACWKGVTLDRRPMGGADCRLTTLQSENGGDENEEPSDTARQCRFLQQVDDEEFLSR
jgi:hypothetical protein